MASPWFRNAGTSRRMGERQNTLAGMNCSQRARRLFHGRPRRVPVALRGVNEGPNTSSYVLPAVAKCSHNPGLSPSL